MQNIKDFLVEIGMEELPPKDLERLSTDFAKLLEQAVLAANISFDITATTIYATPRRLAVLLKDVAAKQQDSIVEKRGPAISAAYNSDGAPTKAALGFATSCGVNFNELKELKTDKGSWLHFTQTVPAQETIALLPALVTQALNVLPIKKTMRWGKGEVAFVRPVHWVLMLYGNDVVKGDIFGLDSNNISYGHRVHAPNPIKISNPTTYAAQLNDAKVIVEFANRRKDIIDAINELATKQHGTAVIDPALLDQVTGLVEYPVALLATFNPDFLRIPKECLISAMQDHQKCFALLDKNGSLMPQFILISNIASTDPQTVIYGNELVMNARLADAAFYFDKDQQQKLADRVPQLKTVIYQKKLGTIYDKVLRIEKLATFIAKQLGANSEHTQRAAYLCKADLLTNMVYEFPELQGIMGKYYALHDQEPKIVAQAIEDHYKPRFANDTLPTTAEAVCVALADRIDTLVGFFGIGSVPTGEKDPYALRRQALAVMRILISLDKALDLKELFNTAIANYGSIIANPSNELMTFCLERIKSYYLNDFSPQIFAAVLAIDINSPLDFYNRLQAVKEFQQLPAATNLAAANKRVQNILEKNNVASQSNDYSINTALLTEPEQKLYAEILKQESAIEPLLTACNYHGVLKSLATLQDPVDQFFTHVMVMVEDPALRNNRMYLLQRVRNLFITVADVSLL
jgi:glycyl-tRNA synthetase beta chain